MPYAEKTSYLCTRKETVERFEPLATTEKNAKLVHSPHHALQYLFFLSPLFVFNRFYSYNSNYNKKDGIFIYLRVRK
jgi:hypothetical protein